MKPAVVRRLRALRGRAPVRVVLAALVVPVVLAGCSGDPAPEPAPIESASPSASASPEETPSAAPSEGPPEMPAAAQGTGPRSAEAFVRYAVDVLNYTAATLDTEPLRSISAPGCTACRSLNRFTNEVRADGGSARGGLWTIDQLFVVGRAPTGDDDLVVQALVNAQAQVFREAAGAKVQRFPASTTNWDFTLTPDAATWSLREMRQGGS